MPELEANGTRLHYHLEGPEAGPVVLLSNSLASTLRMWESQVPALVEAGFRVLRYDTRGHGLSAAPEGPYSLELLTADALALLDGLGLSRVHFCGLSLGGMVGQMLGIHHRERLISLALCDTTPYGGPPETWDERIGNARKNGMAALADATLDRWFTKAGQRRLPDAVRRVREMIVGTSLAGYTGCGAAIQSMDLREAIAAIPTPTLVIVGEQDPGTTVNTARQIQARIQGAALAVIPDSAHLCNIEQPEAFNRALLSFLEAHR